MKATRLLYLLCALPLPSCLIYDESLLAAEDDSVSTGGGSPTEDDAGSGGDVSGSGGNTAAGGSSPGVGGSGQATGGDTAAGGTPASGGTGTGGAAPVCDPEAGDMSAPITPAPTTTKIIENFNLSGSPVLAGGNSSPITGSWYQAALNTTPHNGSWLYERDPCLDASGKQMRVQGTPTEAYGVSFDATLEVNALTIDASAFDGVMYWARSNTAMPQTIRIAFRDTAALSVDTPSLVIGQAWTQHKVAFPAAIDATKLKLVQLVAYGDGPYDFWVEDLVFYKD